MKEYSFNVVQRTCAEKTEKDIIQDKFQRKKKEQSHKQNNLRIQSLRDTHPPRMLHPNGKGQATAGSVPFEFFAMPWLPSNSGA